MHDATGAPAQYGRAYPCLAAIEAILISLYPFRLHTWSKPNCCDTSTAYNTEKVHITMKRLLQLG